MATESYGKAEDPFVAEVLGMEIRTKDVKLMQALIGQTLLDKYAQYGGRIIAQQMGGEPYDTMHTFLKEEEKNGSFKILDKSFEAPFWDYYADESKHSFYKKGSKEEQEVLDKFFK